MRIAIAFAWTVFALAAVTYGSELETVEDFLQNHCLECHSGPESERGFDIEQLAASWDPDSVEQDVLIAWEKSLLRIQSRQMPPPDAGRPEEAEYESVVATMDGILDRYSKRNPHPGETLPVRRMTRTEYWNSIRDLLAIEVDVDSFLPPDSSSDGFDNITVGELSPMLMDRYLTAATRVSRAAVGTSVTKPGGITVRVPPDQSQQRHVAGLPIGTRGGTLIKHYFPRDGEYEIQVRLTRDRDERVEGMKAPHDLDVLVDRERKKRFHLKPVRGGRDYSGFDSHLNVRVNVSAGEHAVGVTFVEKSTSLLEIKRQPFHASFNRYRHPRQSPAVHEVSIVGPFDQTGSTIRTPESGNDSTSRRKIFVARPDEKRSAHEAAELVFRKLLRIAYRRPIDQDDLAVPMRFFDETLKSENQSDVSDSVRYERGIEAGLTSVLVNPNFLFRTVEQPKDLRAGMSYRISDIAIASRLSFFLWSSLPDESLLVDAESGRLSDPNVLREQTLRMLADPRSNALVESFADQWLYLRNLADITPDLRLFPDFDDNLRDAFAGETKHLFADIMARDASVLELISARHSFLNERLAMHYGIPGVVGDHFRRVELDPKWRRGGLLRHGSILTVTSYATRTSPTIRGAWVLENILGTPPPPPPPNVPPIEEKASRDGLNFREQLAMHRENAACASCHDLIDPVGFALDRYDALGRWRMTVEGRPVDVSGRLPDGQTVIGVQQLEQGILQRPELFVMALVEKLMTYAVGRPMEYSDRAAIRRIVRDAEPQDYRFSSLVAGITSSDAFLMRTSQ